MTNTSWGRAGGEESIDNGGDLDVDLEGGNRPSTCEVIDWSGTLTLTARLACLGGQSFDTVIRLHNQHLTFAVKVMNLEDDCTLKG